MEKAASQPKQELLGLADMANKTKEQRIDVGTKHIGNFVTDAYSLRLDFQNNELECCASIEVHDKNDSISPTKLISLLRNNDVIDTVDLEQIAIFCGEAAQDQTLENFVLASGTAPVDGEDGWFELVVNTGNKDQELTEDEQGRVNFKNIQSFSNIEAGQVIGKLYPPTPGENGRTVTGKTIPPNPGKASPVKPGRGVTLNKDGTMLIAELSGRAVYDKNTLSVVEEMVISGDVDFNVGHISFNGFVEIKGDVLDDFNISATKGINVSGTVGACQIKSGGPVTLGSMAGKGIGKVICQGAFRSRYLNQARIECHGDIYLEYEMRNSSLKSTGVIYCQKGVISGGECIALEGIEVKTLGARAGAKTTVTAGVYFPEEDRLQFLRTRTKSVAEQAKSIEETLAALNKKPLQKLRPALREAFELRIDILTQRQANLEEENEELRKELATFEFSQHSTANPKINVLNELREKVTIILGEASEETTYDLSGPMSIIENPTSGGLRYLTYSPLQVTAQKLEKEQEENDDSNPPPAEIKAE